MTNPMNRDEAVQDRVASILLEAGWRSPCDAQWENLRKALPDLLAALTALRSGGGEDWQARALSAEADIERMTEAFNRENGPTFMGEPVLPPEKMVELDDGVQVPTWLLDQARRVELYMKAKLPGPWRIGGIQSHDYPHPQPARGEAVAWARQSGDPNDDAFVISAKVKRLWMASNPKRVARYTRPLYTTHVPCWALPAVESALSMLDLQGYWHSDLAAFRDWLKEKSG